MTESNSLVDQLRNLHFKSHVRSSFGRDDVEYIMRAKYHSGSKCIATASSNHKLKLYKALPDGGCRLVKDLKGIFPSTARSNTIGHTGPIQDLAFFIGNAEGSTLVSGSSDCSARIWDIRTSKSDVTFESEFGCFEFILY